MQTKQQIPDHSAAAHYINSSNRGTGLAVSLAYPSGEEGVITFFTLFLPAVAALRERGVSTLCPLSICFCSFHCSNHIILEEPAFNFKYGLYSICMTVHTIKTKHIEDKLRQQDKESSGGGGDRERSIKSL
jgi:hypothetical protein